MWNRERFSVHAEMLSPVCIKSGNAYFPYEYALIDTILYRFDFLRFLDFLETVDEEARKKLDGYLEESVKSVKKDSEEKGIVPLRKEVYELACDLEIVQEWIVENALYRCETTEKFRIMYKINIQKDRQDNESNRLAVEELPRSLGRIYVPGSSLKGAIRTALSAYDFEGEMSRGDEGKNVSVENDPFRALLVTDSFSVEGKVLIGILERTLVPKKEKKPAREQQGKEKDENGGISVLHELFPSGVKFDFDIAIHHDKKKEKNVYRLQTPRGEKREIVWDITKESLIEGCNRYMASKLQNSIDAVKGMFEGRRHKDGIAEILQKRQAYLEKMQKKLQEPDFQNGKKFLLRVGFGGGYVFKTLSKECFADAKCADLPKRPKNGKFDTNDNAQDAFTHWHLDEAILGFIECEIRDAPVSKG